MAEADALAVVMLEAGLSVGEVRALTLSAEGLSPAEIGRRLRITENAVACRLSAAKQKLHAQQARRESVAWQQRPERLPHERLRWRREQLRQALNEAG